MKTIDNHVPFESLLNFYEAGGACAHGAHEGQGTMPGTCSIAACLLSFRQSLSLKLQGAGSLQAPVMSLPLPPTVQELQEQIRSFSVGAEDLNLGPHTYIPSVSVGLVTGSLITALITL